MRFLIFLLCIYAQGNKTDAATPTRTTTTTTTTKSTPATSNTPDSNSTPSDENPITSISSDPTEVPPVNAGKSDSGFVSKNLVWIVVGSIAVGVILIGMLLFCCARSVGGSNRKDTDSVLPWNHRPIQLQGSRPSVGSGSTPVQFGSSASTSPPASSAANYNNAASNYSNPSSNYNNAQPQLPLQPLDQSYGGYDYNQQSMQQQPYDYNYNQQQQYAQYPQRIESPVLDQSFGLGVTNDEIPAAENIQHNQRL